MAKIKKLQMVISEDETDDRHPGLPRIIRCLKQDDIRRPIETVRFLCDILLPSARPCRPVAGLLRQQPGEHQNKKFWVVMSGHITLYRYGDDMEMGVYKAPALIGLQELFVPLGRHYFRVSREAEAFELPSEQVRQIIDTHQLWKIVAEVLAFHLRMMAYRDEHMVSQSADTIIRAKLLEYMGDRDFHIQNRTGIAEYILSNTRLARSTIYNILRSLENEGHILINRGKLERILSFPPEKKRTILPKNE